IRIRLFRARRPGALHEAKPDLPPEGVDRARTEETVLAQVADARHAVEDEAVVEVDQPAVLLVDDLVRLLEHAELPAPITHHFDVEPGPAVPLALVERRDDLLLGLDLHEIAGSQAESLSGSLGLGSSGHVRIRTPASPALNRVEARY